MDGWMDGWPVDGVGRGGAGRHQVDGWMDG